MSNSNTQPTAAQLAALQTLSNGSQLASNSAGAKNAINGHTLRSLLKKGFATQTCDQTVEPWRIENHITEAGRAAIAQG